MTLLKVEYNKMKINYLKSTLALALTSVSGFALANGLAINEQSASSAGTAYAGRSSSAQDSSTIFGNPAGLSKLKRTEVSGGLAIIKADVDISHVSSTDSGTNKGDMVPNAVVPFGFFATPIDENWAVGLGVYVPFAVISDYEKSFQGRSHGIYSKVQVITVQPTVSYKFNDYFAIGFGPTINKIDGKLTNTLATAGLSQMVGGPNIDTRINIKGDDTAYGYNLGIMVNPTPDTTIGATYHSKVKYKLEGHTNFQNVPNLPLSMIGLPASGTLGNALNGKYKAKLDVTLPESLDLSVTHKLDDQWTLYAGTVWTRWSRLESLDVRNSGMSAVGNAMGFNNIGEPLKWEDTWSWAIGTSYQWNKEWVFRAGFAFDPSPTSNEHRNVRIPVGDRKIFTLGAGWSPTDDLTIDLAYAYLHENTAGVNQSGKSLNTSAGSVDLQPAYYAKYDNSAHGFTAQMTYRF